MVYSASVKLILAFVLATRPVSLGRQDQIQQSLTTAASQPPDSNSSKTSKSGAQAKVPLGDYVPCLFNSDEEMEMHTRQPEQKTRQSASELIDAPTANRIVQATSAAIVGQGRPSSTFDDSASFTKEFQLHYLEALPPINLIGKTPDEAYTVIEKALQTAADKVKSQFAYNAKPTVTKDQVEQQAAEMLQSLKGAVKTTASNMLRFRLLFGI